ncbi:MAG TPA: hypothetical protein VMG12_31625 [Polyangiaceae bacterium]|nr:hypothetical protein [Polyangiaceae bacterium]
MRARPGATIWQQNGQQSVFGQRGFFLGAATFASAISVGITLFGVGCTHYVGRGSDLYYQGRYIEAAHVLEMSERQLRGADEEDRASYGLYRGATLFRLGDLDGARRWLEYSEQLTVSHPDMLRPEQRELLQETMIAVRADLDRRAAARGM